jgi:hypothetical protein
VGTHGYPCLSPTSPAAATELGILLQALQPVSLQAEVPDHRGIGQVMVPFSSKVFYRHHMSQLPANPVATCIWDNVALPRCRQFLWLLHHRRLPTAVLLHHRNIIYSPFCGYCGEIEDQKHLFLRCPRAVPVWRALGWLCAPHLADCHDL